MTEKKDATEVNEEALTAAYEELKNEHIGDKWFTLDWSRKTVAGWISRGRPNANALAESSGDIVMCYKKHGGI